MQGALRVDPRKLKTKGVASVRSRVANISDYCAEKLTVTDFTERLNSFILEYFPDITPYRPSQGELNKIEDLAQSKYRSFSWTFKKFGNYAFKSSAQLASGIVNASFEVTDGKITALSLTGDFFGIKDSSVLCETLLGISHNKESVLNALSGIEVSEYISGFTKNDLLSLFF